MSPPPPWRRWLPAGPALLLFGGAVLAAIALRPAMDRSLWQVGALYFVHTFERWLPVLGLGCLVAQLKPRAAAAAGLLFALGTAAGLAAEPPLVAAIGARHDLWTALLLASGPLSAVAAGLGLAAPSPLRSWLAAPTALTVGAQLGLAVQLDGPALGGVGFTAAALAAAGWLAASVVLTWRRFARPWLAVGGRILGSWLTAIGLLLGGAMLAPKHESAASATPSATLAIPVLPQGGGFHPLPDLDPGSAPPGFRGLDPSRQP